MSNNTELVAADQLLSRINTLHSAVSEALSTALTHAMEAGKLLTELKGKCPHGTFRKVLIDSFAGSQQTASFYMRLHAHRQSILTKGAVNLTLSQAADLIPKGKPRGKPKQSRELTKPEPASTTVRDPERIGQFVAALSDEQLTELHFALCLDGIARDPTGAEMRVRLALEIYSAPSHRQRLLAFVDGDQLQRIRETYLQEARSAERWDGDVERAEKLRALAASLHLHDMS